MSQTIIITAAGRAALINAANTGTNPATITQMGITQTAFTPTAAATSLPGELKRVTTMAGVAVADDAIHLTVRDDSTAAYTMRGYAFYLSDGTLFALYGQSAAIVNKTAASMMLLSLDIAFADVTTENIEFGDANFILPIATTTVYGQVKLATLAAAQTGTDNSSVLTPATARQAILGWLLAQDGSGSGLDADTVDGLQASTFLQASLFTGTQILSRLTSVDGSGSGLDADTVDGLDASSFLQASLFTGAQMLSRLISVDGSGSGLDADLLDGQHASYFTAIADRLGYTPLNAANYTGADILTKLLDVDGSGSGLDADTVDGLQASSFLQAVLFTGAQIISRLGYTPLDTADYTAANVRAKLVTVDGAGSGVDADLLDGKQASEFIAAAAMVGTNQSLNANGWQKLPGGLILQWGIGSSEYGHNTAANAQSVTFPIAFPSAALCCVAGSDVATPSNADAIFQTHTLTRTGVRLYNNLFNNDGKGYCTPRWIALGH